MLLLLLLYLELSHSIAVAAVAVCVGGRHRSVVEVVLRLQVVELLQVEDCILRLDVVLSHVVAHVLLLLRVNLVDYLLDLGLLRDRQEPAHPLRSR